MPEYVFICGCPRSGTTALTHLVNCHPAVFVGIERYAKLLHIAPHKMTPELFTTERFSNILEGDCGYKTFDDFSEYQQEYSRKFDQGSYADTTHRGDKIPTLYEYFETIDSPAWRNIKITIFQIVRDVYDVARSYEIRKIKNNQKERWQRGFKRGVDDWTLSMIKGYEMYKKPPPNCRHLIINYENIFPSDYDGFTDGCSRLFSALGLKFEDVDVRKLSAIYAHSLRLSRVRGKGAESISEEMILKLVASNAVEAYSNLKVQAIV